MLGEEKRSGIQGVAPGPLNLSSHELFALATSSVNVAPFVEAVVCYFAIEWDAMLETRLRVTRDCGEVGWESGGRPERGSGLERWRGLLGPRGWGRDGRVRLRRRGVRR